MDRGDQLPSQDTRMPQCLRFNQGLGRRNVVLLSRRKENLRSRGLQRTNHTVTLSSRRRISNLESPKEKYKIAYGSLEELLGGSTGKQV